MIYKVLIINTVAQQILQKKFTIAKKILRVLWAWDITGLNNTLILRY